MALSRPPSRSDSDWPDEILDAAREEFNGELEIRKPGAADPYDPITGKYGPTSPGEIVITRRPARAQHIRLPLDSNDGNGWDVRQRYRFQYEIQATDPSVSKGLVVYFFGGRDPELAKTTYQVQRATNSSHAALRTVECVTETGHAAA